MKSLATHEAPLVWHGTFIHSISPEKIDIIVNGLLVLSSTGRILFMKRDILPDQIIGCISAIPNIPTPSSIRILKRGEFLIPGLVDTHNHATQWAQRGTGRGLEIMDWLNTITYPHEAKFDDPEYARKMYPKCVDGFIRQGVTLAAYYGGLNGEATKTLVDVCIEKGQRALVGKCNMVQNAPDFCRDRSSAESLRATEDFIAYVQSDLVRPIISPRFAISCDDELLSGLGKIASRGHMIQTHFNESSQEIALTKELFPQFDNEADLYEHYGLFNSKTIMAHAIHPTEYEIGRMKDVDVGVSHCPIGNTTAGEWGTAPIRRYLDLGIKVGLGTDSGGGYSSSILDASRQAIITSNALQTLTGAKALTLYECFYLATLGGVKVCGLEDKIGTFEVGKEFDALEITMLEGISTEIEDDDSVEVIFEKFLMTGDDRNIAKVYVKGRSIKV